MASPLRVLADQAFSRAAGAHLVEGNRVDLLRDAKENYPAWLEAIRSAERWVHFAGCGRWFNLWRNTVSHEIGPAYLPFTTQPKAPGHIGQEGSKA